MINRAHYFQQLADYIDKPLIKVITGIRRSGKSVLLSLLKDTLLDRGIKESQIIYINFESFTFSHLIDATTLYTYIQSKIVNKEKYYLLFDEIQEVAQWEKSINAFRVDFDTDIYITGSNSHLLSSELATLLSGRYVQFNVYTLSFLEYIQFKKEYDPLIIENQFEAFDNYLKWGGFPTIHTGNYQRDQAYKIVFDIYSSVILRDVVQRFKIRDIELLERVVKYVFDNIGNKFSAKNVSDYFKSQNRKLDINTVYNYLKGLSGSYIIYSVPRFDIKGKEILKTNEKFFVGDISLIYSVLGFRESMISGLLENIVFLELMRRGYTVYIGKMDTLEIDFIAEKPGVKIYIQVTYTMQDPSTRERELKPLMSIQDNFPKYIISMDKTWEHSIEGIKQMHITDFLMKDI